VARRFEVTIPFKRGGWYSQDVDADGPEMAKSLVINNLRRFGTIGMHGAIKAKEVNQ
jgi:hypothetical protein